MSGSCKFITIFIFNDSIVHENAIHDNEIDRIGSFITGRSSILCQTVNAILQIQLFHCKPGLHYRLAGFLIQNRIAVLIRCNNFLCNILGIPAFNDNCFFQPGKLLHIVTGIRNDIAHLGNGKYSAGQTYAFFVHLINSQEGHVGNCNAAIACVNGNGIMKIGGFTLCIECKACYSCAAYFKFRCGETFQICNSINSICKIHSYSVICIN